MNSNWSYSPEKTQLMTKSAIFCPLWHWHMTLKNNRVILLCYFKLCASFHCHQWNQTGVTVQKYPFRVNFDDFMSHVTLKFDGWPRNTIGHLFYVNSSFVHHFVAVGEFKLELQSKNGQFGSKVVFFVPVTLKFDRWPWKTIGQLFYATSRYMCIIS